MVTFLRRLCSKATGLSANGDRRGSQSHQFPQFLCRRVIRITESDLWGSTPYFSRQFYSGRHTMSDFKIPYGGWEHCPLLEAFWDSYPSCYLSTLPLPHPSIHPTVVTCRRGASEATQSLWVSTESLGPTRVVGGADCRCDAVYPIVVFGG